jgi:hypothetical protein
MTSLATVPRHGWHPQLILDANGDQMATWTYRRSSVTAADASVLASKPLLLFRKNGPIVFTKNYVKHRLFSKKTYPQGTEGMITKFTLALSVES